MRGICLPLFCALVSTFSTILRGNASYARYQNYFAINEHFKYPKRKLESMISECKNDLLKKNVILIIFSYVYCIESFVSTLFGTFYSSE